MKTDHSERELMYKMKHSVPHLRDLNGFAQEVMKEVDKVNSKNLSALRVTVGFYLKYAAVFLILFGFGNYVWQEISTYRLRNQMLAQVIQTHRTSVSEPRCSQRISFVIKSLGSSPLQLFKNRIILRQRDVMNLFPAKSSYYLEAQLFIAALEKYYPKDYQTYRSKGSVELSVSELENDQRLCEMFK